ncbi:MAG: hypothetical protein H6Q14_1286 [Bacteroidetes bacterium]|jgi:hypothetical protein|nr:hypothetical protein [Bacteroidota bacterium]
MDTSKLNKEPVVIKNDILKCINQVVNKLNKPLKTKFK